MKNITQKDVLKAIEDSGGIMTRIARKLHCNWNTARTYCNKWESTRIALKDETEKMLDIAEMALFDAIKKGDVNAVKWYLSTKGKERGYTTEIEKTNETADNDNVLRIVICDQEGNQLNGFADNCNTSLFNSDNIEIYDGQ